MTAKELITELEQIPANYEVQVILGKMGGDPTQAQDVEAASAYMVTAAANHEANLAYLFGIALPKPTSAQTKINDN